MFPDFRPRTKSVHQCHRPPSRGREPWLVSVGRVTEAGGKTNNGLGDAMGGQSQPRRNAVEKVSVRDSHPPDSLMFTIVTQEKQLRDQMDDPIGEGLGAADNCRSAIM